MPVLQGCICRSWLLPVLQDAMDAMAKEKARLRADMEYLQAQLDLVTQQAEAAAAAAAAAATIGSSGYMPQVQASHLVAQDHKHHWHTRGMDHHSGYSDQSWSAWRQQKVHSCVRCTFCACFLCPTCTVCANSPRFPNYLCSKGQQEQACWLFVSASYCYQF